MTAIGPNRCGKTKLIKYLTRKLESRVVVDPRNIGDYSEPEWGPHVSDPAALCYLPRAVWHPPLAELRRRDDPNSSWSRGLRYLFEVRGARSFKEGDTPVLTVIFDEGRYCAPTNPHDGVQLLYVSGSGKGIGVFTLAQSAFYLTGDAIAQAFDLFCFRIQNAQERARLAGNAQVDVDQLASLKPHYFMHLPTGAADFSGPYILPKRFAA